MNIERDNLHIKNPGTLKLGADEATKLNSFIAGTVAIDFVGNVPATAIASASAAVTGLTAGFNVLILPQADFSDSGQVKIVAAAAGAGILTVTAFNASGSAIDTTSTTCQFFAWS